MREHPSNDGWGPLPPSTYGVYLSAHDDDTVDILAQGQKLRVGLHPTIKVESLRPGQELLLNEALNAPPTSGTVIPRPSCSPITGRSGSSARPERRST